jgi:hypothetical protein
MPSPLHVQFVAAARGGPWSITSVTAIVGDPLPTASSLTVTEVPAGSGTTGPADAAWALHGIVSNERYVEREEKTRLALVQEGLGRPGATSGALIPIHKSDAWWQLPQDDRRAIFEARSSHIKIGLEALPAVARRLHHCRDLGGPFDFLTWFEFAPEHGAAFDDLLGALRATEEWDYVDREVEVRVSR